MFNRYWALRHGRSLANESGVIVSKIENGVLKKYGLSETGREQAAVAAQKIIESCKSIIIFSSDFSRTREVRVL